MCDYTRFTHFWAFELHLITGTRVGQNVWAQCPHILRLVWECSGGPKNNAPRKTCSSPFWSIFSAFNKSAPRPLFWASNAPIKSPNRCCGAEEGGNTCREVESNNYFDFWLALNEWIITSPVHHAISQAQDGYVPGVTFCPFFRPLRRRVCWVLVGLPFTVIKAHEWTGQIIPNFEKMNTLSICQMYKL